MAVCKSDIFLNKCEGLCGFTGIVKRDEMEQHNFNKISTARVAARSGGGSGTSKCNGYSYLQYSWKYYFGVPKRGN